MRRNAARRGRSVQARYCRSCMSVFLDLDPSDWVGSNELAFAVRDAFPVSPGHTLVIPRRLIVEWWEATPTERLAMFELVDVIKRRLDAEYAPDGYNVGFNAGTAAGQTVGHLHVHVIPRFDGDMRDPRGGVRHVIPERGNYLEPTGPRAQPPPTLITQFDGHLRVELLRCLIRADLDRIDLLGELRDAVWHRHRQGSTRRRSGPRRPRSPPDDRLSTGHRLQRARLLPRSTRQRRARPPGGACLQRPINELSSEGVHLLVIAIGRRRRLRRQQQPQLLRHQHGRRVEHRDPGDRQPDRTVRAALVRRPVASTHGGVAGRTTSKHGRPGGSRPRATARPPQTTYRLRRNWRPRQRSPSSHGAFRSKH